MSGGRKGFKTEAEYREACRRARSIKQLALSATGVRHTHWAILAFICHGPYNEFHSVDVTVTKEQIMRGTGTLDMKTVKVALRALRAEGTLTPIRNWQGGRSVPTTYRIAVAGQGGQEATKPEPIEQKKEQGASDPVLARMREIMAERPDLDAMRAYTIAEAENS